MNDHLHPLFRQILDSTLLAKQSQIPRCDDCTGPGCDCDEIDEADRRLAAQDGTQRESER